MKVRRLGVLVATLSIAASVFGAIPAMAGPGASAGEDQIAVADWTVWTSKTHGIWYFAVADRGASLPFGAYSDAAVLRGTCARQSSKHMTLVVCHASGRGHLLLPSEFQMDPMLASADLSFKQGRFKQTVRWKGMGRAPTPAVQQYADASGVLIATADERAAQASAHIFGKTLGPQPMQLAFFGLESSAYVTTGAHVSTGRDGTITADRTYRVR